MVLEGTQQSRPGWIPNANWSLLEGPAYSYYLRIWKGWWEVCFFQRWVWLHYASVNIVFRKHSSLSSHWLWTAVRRRQVLGLHRVDLGWRLPQKSVWNGLWTSQGSDRCRSLLHSNRTDVFLQSKQVSHPPRLRNWCLNKSRVEHFLL